jgi:predicted HD phosphohydrolase
LFAERKGDARCAAGRIRLFSLSPTADAGIVVGKFQRRFRRSSLPNSDPTLPKLQDAVAYAFRAHAGQVRKGTAIPYISHLLAVGSIVMEYGGDEDLACAALLHDTIEDCGVEHEALIRQRFGDRVARIVRACSDTDIQPKPPWLARKRAYLEHLGHADADTLLVSCADKLHNARAIVSDLRTHGIGMLTRFNAPAGGTQWYYRALADVFLQRSPGSLSRELDITVCQLETLLADAPQS